ncbi:carbohydrate binding domain-containing protein [Paraglaciecola aquimarina]|uniref:Carbohydrate binding domain-containing protein n=1 Tax=Paraglaciecola algarum TaxID=3050085 RepID=A0ABS9D8P6_9ALTE|nr:carbohydrate binding domain-containing protein [Paraglaciecola sp. G1-23]MCF2948041.1 carbohydrate binding domain-containing protein [Paraglaciecola sp. G1-23]
MTFKLNKTYLAIGLLYTSAPFFSFAETANVEIDLSTQHYLGDTSQLQRNKFFNLHARGGNSPVAEIDQLYIRNELNADYGRSFWGPLSEAGNANYPSTEYAMEKGPISNAANRAHPLFNYGSNRTINTEHPSNVMVEGYDQVEGARWAADYYEYYFDDETRPLFYEPMNEPFVHASDFVDGPWDNNANQAVQVEMAKWFNEIAREFNARGLSTKVIGFSSAWPSFELNDFSNWETRMKMFIDVAGENIDGLSYHLYDGVNVTGQSNYRSGSNAEAIIDMMETYSHITLGVVKPHAITEYGGIVKGYPIEYSAEQSSQSLRSYNHLLFQFLNREDRLLTSTPFITDTAKWFYEANDFNPYPWVVLRPDPDSIVAGKVNNFLPTEKANFYHLWANVKGHRVAIDTQDPDLGAQAFVYGDRVFVALNNYEDGSKDVQLDFLPHDGTLENVRIKRLDAPYKEAAKYTDEVVNNAPNALTLMGHETVVLEYKYQAPIEHTQASKTTNYYADTYLQPIAANSPIMFTFDGVEVDQHSLSFTDAYASGFEYDQAVVDSISNNSTKRYESVLRSYNKQFEKIIADYPDTWSSSSDYQKLVARAQRSNTTVTALHYHYSMHGYNDSQNKAVLKMSIGRKHDKSKQPIVKVNGHTVAVPTDWKGYDQVTRDDFFGSIEIPVEAKYLKETNHVSLEFPDTQGHVSSLVLEVDTQKVYDKVAISELALTETDVVINKDKPYRIKSVISPANATNQYITWTSSDNSVATVDADGVIHPVVPGYTSITATTYDGGHTQSVNVEVADKLTVRNTVSIKNDVSKMDPTNAITLELAYSSDEDREVSFELYSPTNQWLGLAKVTVPAGKGDTSLTLSFAEELPAGKGYRVIASLRAIDGDWRTSVDGHTISDVEITSPYVPPTPEEGNLLGINGGFEVGHLNDWKIAWDALGSAEVLSEAAKDGEFGVKIDTTDGKIGILIDEDILPLGLIKAGKTFKLSFYMKRVSGTNWAGGFAQLINTTDGWKASPQPPWHGTAASPSDWILVEKEFSGLDWPDTGTSLQINMQTAGQVWYLDNIKLEDTSPVIVAPETNILANVNPSFEDATIAPWVGYWENNTSTNMLITADAASDGLQGLHLTSDGLTNTGINLAPEVMPQDLGLGEGKDYTISFDIKSNNGNVTGYIRNVSGESWGTRIETWFAAGTEWKTVTITRTQQDWAGLANARLDLYLFGNGGSADIDVYIDNIIIQPVTP